MTQEQLESLLGRPLTPVEVTNIDLYLDIAKESLESMLCLSLEEVSETRTFDVREGMRTVFTGLFNNLDEVKIDGEIIAPEDYSSRQWDKRNADWFNSIVFNRTRGCREIEVTADWGFGGCYPKDFELLISRYFNLISKENNFDREVNSKSVEDFSISYNHSSITMADTLAESFAKDNAILISKYSQCTSGQIVNGKVCHDYGLRRIYR